ncbi:Uncharacterized protein OBRU01_07373, partial [Operophtera brumata]
RASAGRHGACDRDAHAAERPPRRASRAAVRVARPSRASPCPVIYTNANRCNFVTSIESVDWFEVSQMQSTADGLSKTIVNILINKLDICFPLKRVTVRTKKDSWVTQDIVSLDFLLREIKYISLKFPTNVGLSNKLDEFQDKFNNILRTERSQFYCNIILNAKNTTKSMWEVVKLETGRSRRNLDFVESIRTPDGFKYASKAEAVGAINSYFVNAAATCGAPATDVKAAMRALVGARAPADRSLRLRPFTPFEVFTIISKGVAHKPTKDIYEVSVSLMYAAAAPLAYILSILFNLCVRDGQYPQILKNVRVSPLYKGKGKKEDISSYRPVSINPAIAKIFECGLSARVTAYLEATKSLSDRQYAYRTGRSTTEVARELVPSSKTAVSKLAPKKSAEGAQPPALNGLPAGGGELDKLPPSPPALDATALPDVIA